MCALRRSKHAVYDLKYQFVWIPKYRKKLLTPEIADYTKELFERIAEEYGLIIDTREVVEDHVHIFLEAPPRLSPSRIVQILKGISARELFRQFPHLRQKLWGWAVLERWLLCASCGRRSDGRCHSALHRVSST